MPSSAGPVNGGEAHPLGFPRRSEDDYESVGLCACGPRSAKQRDPSKAAVKETRNCGGLSDDEDVLSRLGALELRMAKSDSCLEMQAKQLETLDKRIRNTEQCMVVYQKLGGADLQSKVQALQDDTCDWKTRVGVLEDKGESLRSALESSEKCEAKTMKLIEDLRQTVAAVEVRCRMVEEMSNDAFSQGTPVTNGYQKRNRGDSMGASKASTSLITDDSTCIDNVEAIITNGGAKDFSAQLGRIEERLANLDERVCVGLGPQGSHQVCFSRFESMQRLFEHLNSRMMQKDEMQNLATLLTSELEVKTITASMLGLKTPDLTPEYRQMHLGELRARMKEINKNFQDSDLLCCQGADCEAEGAGDGNSDEGLSGQPPKVAPSDAGAKDHAQRFRGLESPALKQDQSSKTLM